MSLVGTRWRSRVTGVEVVIVRDDYAEGGRDRRPLLARTESGSETTISAQTLVLRYVGL